MKWNFKKTMHATLCIRKRTKIISRPKTTTTLYNLDVPSFNLSSFLLPTADIENHRSLFIIWVGYIYYFIHCRDLVSILWFTLLNFFFFFFCLIFCAFIFSQWHDVLSRPPSLTWSHTQPSSCTYRKKKNPTILSSHLHVNPADVFILYL
jgi:hypothetical protein